MIISVKESYDQIAKYFSNTRVFTWKWTDKFLLENTDKNYNNFILDIGSGNGRNCNNDVNSSNIYFGFDISFEQLKMNKSNIKIDTQGDMISMPFRNNTFDLIISIASFHHLNTIDQRKQCLKEMNRILKKNGKILLSVWSINQPDKTKRKFNNYGDTIVNWNTNKHNENKIIPRYYYIFELNEIENLLNEQFIIDKYYWDCGNEIFELKSKF